MQKIKNIVLIPAIFSLLCIQTECADDQKKTVMNEKILKEELSRLSSHSCDSSKSVYRAKKIIDYLRSNPREKSDHLKTIEKIITKSLDDADYYFYRAKIEYETSLYVFSSPWAEEAGNNCKAMAQAFSDFLSESEKKIRQES